MAGLFEHKKRQLEEHITQAVQGTPIDETVVEDELFVEAAYDASAAERGGYSNYSYWRSTLNAFLHNKMAVAMLIVLALLLAFTIIQPLLPGQYAPNTINNDPATGIQLANQSPALTTVMATAEDGTVLIGSRVDDNWYRVTNVAATLKAREKFTVVEYGEDWCRIEYDGGEGYVQNNFQTKLKLPDDPTAVPYESKSSFPLSVYREPADYTNNGSPLYAASSHIKELENGDVVTVGETELRNIPSDHAFIFGTNNIGQDLWARVWSGTRTSLWIGFVVAFFEAFIGIAVGIAWGYVRALDRIITEIYNVLDNIPNTIILILISYIMRPGIGTLIFAMCAPVSR